MVPNLKNPEPVMTGARQTMLTWARVIESYAEVPANFKEVCKSILAESQPFPYLVFAPAIRTAQFRVTEKLLCEHNGALHIWESEHGQITARSYAFENICLLEIGNILLNSWLMVSGVTGEGKYSSTAVPFNTATLRHFLPFIQKIRPAKLETAELAWQAELAKFDDLASASFKFMNFARESLVRGEMVMQSVWQPKILQQRFTLFGHSFDRTTCLSHLAILTDTELILIRDDEHSTENRGVRYGGVWQYIPLRHIKRLTLSEPAADLLTLTMELDGGGHGPELVFAAANQAELKKFRERLN